MASTTMLPEIEFTLCLRSLLEFSFKEVGDSFTKFFFMKSPFLLHFWRQPYLLNRFSQRKMGVTGRFHHDFCDYMSRGIFAKFDMHMEKLVQHTRGCLDASKIFYIAVSPVT